MIDERVKALIQARLDVEMLVAHQWRVGDDGTEVALGRYVALEDGDEGVLGGDEGELVACVVGAQKYGNERVMFGLTPDGMDCSLEVSLHAVEPA